MALHGPRAGIAVAVPTTSRPVCAGVRHVVEMVRDHNVHPGNTSVYISDFGVSISLWAPLLASHAA